MSMTVCLCSCRVTDKVTVDSWRWTTTSTRQAGDHSRCFPSPTIPPVPELYKELWQCWSVYVGNNHRTMVTTFICFCFVYLFIFSSTFSTVQTLCLISCVVVVSHDIISSFKQNYQFVCPLFCSYLISFSYNSIIPVS